MRKALVWLAAVAVGMVVPSGAQAADDFRAGEQADPAGDASIVYGDYGGSPARLLDVRKVRVEYDAGVGSLSVQFNGSLNGVGHAGLLLYANLSAPNPSGRCDGTLRAGDFRIEGQETARDYLGFTQYADLRDHNGTSLGLGSYENEDQTGNGPRMTFASPSLIRRDLRCVSGVYASKAQSGFNGSSRDDVAAFCLADCPQAPATAAPAIRANGATLTWNKIGNINSYVIATSSAPEGSSGRNTTYRTVTGTSFTPPAVPGATRYYGVRADVADSLWANPEAVVAFPRPADPPTGGQGTTPAPTPKPTPAPGAPSGPTQTTGGGGVNQGIVIHTANTNTQNQTTVVSLRLTAAKARGVAAKALADRYGKAFVRRTKRSYRMACTPDGARAACRVQWRYKRSRYRGRITLTRTPQGDLWRTAIKRTAIRRA